MASPARRHRGRRALVILVVVLAVPAAGYGALRFLLRDEVLRPRLIAAVEQATGRGFTLSGPVGLKLSLVPTVTLDGVALANAPGASRPQMLTARRVEVKLALLPLLSRRVAFERVTLIEPDLLLEIDASGRGNWRFEPARAASPAPAPTPENPVPAASAPLALSVAAIGIEGGRVAWRDARSGKAEALEIRDLDLKAETPAAPIDFEGHFAFRGVALAARGQAGPLPRLLGTQAEPAEWPLRLSLAAPGVQAVLDGSVARPEQAAGWRFSLNATADRADRLAPFLPNAGLPPLTGLDIQAELADAGPGAMPAIQSLRARAAGGDLTALVPGLRLGTATLSIAGAGQPASATAALVMNGVPWQAEASLPPLPTLLSADPWPVGLALNGEGVTARADGTLAGPGRRDLAGTLSVRAADTVPLLRSLALPAPRLRDLQMDTRFAQSGTTISLGALHLQSRELVADGEANLVRGPRPVLAARLTLPRLDLDGLTEAPAAPVAAPSATPAPPPVPAPPATPPVPPAPA
ncbi:MAG: AsmA family protein, partial [Roseomonas sp.]|nr:AsmA family protein [Roseomonas sp.]